MNQEGNVFEEGQDNADEKKNNKGGRQKDQREFMNKKVTFYLTEEEYALLTEFAKTACYTYDYSGAVRRLVLEGLRMWVKKGKKEV